MKEHPKIGLLIQQLSSCLGTRANRWYSAIALVLPQTNLEKILRKVATGFFGQVLATSSIIHSGAAYPLNIQQKQMARALRESEARCQAMFVAATIGIALVNMEGRFLESNSALSELLGYSEEELATKTVFDVTHPKDVAATVDLHKQLLAGNIERSRLEKRYIRKDGQMVYAHLNASLVRDGEGKPQYILCMIENVTERKRVETELNKIRRRLCWSREMERRYLAHELHDEIVQQLLGISYQLVERQKNLRSRQRSEVLPINAPALDTIRQGVLGVVKRLRELIGELLPSGLEEFGLVAALQSYVANVQRERNSDMPEFELILPRQEMPLPESVALCLFRIAQEALRNALQHAQAHHITIRLELLAEEVVLNVHDDGVGFRLPSHLSMLTRGNHFGLLGMVERTNWAQGWLTIDSEPGRGTNVKAHLPLKQEEDEDE